GGAPRRAGRAPRPAGRRPGAGRAAARAGGGRGPARPAGRRGAGALRGARHPSRGRREGRQGARQAPGLYPSVVTAAQPSAPRAHDWGSAPDLYGPRHDYREALILRRLLPALPGSRVLNAGSGAGSLSLRLADASLEVTSVEASP